MGQYHVVINLDKKEWLLPHMLGDGLKLCEFGSGGGTTLALAVLLANNNGEGGGDFFPNDQYEGEDWAGHWAGDRIIIAGDYANPDDIGEEPMNSAGFRNLYTRATGGEFKNISLSLREYLVACGERLSPRLDN